MFILPAKVLQYTFCIRIHVKPEKIVNITVCSYSYTYTVGAMIIFWKVIILFKFSYQIIKDDQKCDQTVKQSR